ncbi:MAG: hypothetical protein K6E47_17245 [Lachnospiraceae bacterium]|nr:hypothetical protein [Lachnospiraceae bacterium]
MTGCQDLGKTDHIVIFFTQNAKNIDMSDISNHGSADLEMIEVPAGKQSADMHIVSYLGYLAGKNGKNCKVVIVSKDTDFDNVIKFWKQKTGISVQRTEQIKKKTEKNGKKSNVQTVSKKSSSKSSSDKKTQLNQEVMQAIRNAGYSGAVANNVAKIASVLYGDERMLMEVHNALRNKYSDYLEVYSAIKPVLSKYADDNQSKNTPQITSQDKKAVNTEIQKVLSKAGFANDIVSFVASTAVKNFGEKTGKQMTYRSIISKFGQNKGLNIYNHIKKYI